MQLTWTRLPQGFKNSSTLFNEALDEDLHLAWIQERPNLQQGEDGWYRDSDGYLILPAQLGRQLCEHLHSSTHLGEKKTLMLFQTARLQFPRHQTTVKNIVHACKACQQMRPGKRQHAGLKYRGEGPGQHWEIDFTEVRPGKYGYRYLLVLVDTFSGWVEAFPTKGETAMVVAKKILEEIVPRFGLLVTVGSDNGPAFVSQIVQSLALALGTKWKLHCEYSPQSSGQVERMNRTLKETLTKLAIETGGDWVTLLPFALFQARNTPYQLNLTPFEILYGRPPPVCLIFEGK